MTAHGELRFRSLLHHGDPGQLQPSRDSRVDDIDGQSRQRLATPQLQSRAKRRDRLGQSTVAAGCFALTSQRLEREQVALVLVDLQLVARSASDDQLSAEAF